MNNKEGLKNEDELQSYFLQRIEKYVKCKITVCHNFVTINSLPVLFPIVNLCNVDQNNKIMKKKNKKKC